MATMNRNEIENEGIGNENTPFSEFLLNGMKTDKTLTEKLEKAGWSGDNKVDDFNVKILFNDVEISMVEMTQMTESWWDRIGDSIRTKVNYYETEENFEKRAKELVQEKLDTLDELIEEAKIKLMCMNIK